MIIQTSSFSSFKHAAVGISHRQGIRVLTLHHDRSSRMCTHLQVETTNDKESHQCHWSHSDIEWKLSPPADMPLMEKVKVQAAAKAIHAQCVMNGDPIPPILCPKGGKAELEAFDAKNGSKIGKFGITTNRGPSAPQIDETLEDLYDIESGDRRFGGPGIGAIIYMFIEPNYRGLGIGNLALEVIAAIQTVQGCDFTVLVADDNGSGKLIDWYKDAGYELAPKLQDLFGSPGGSFGSTMIRPTSVRADIFAKCQIKWW